MQLLMLACICIALHELIIFTVSSNYDSTDVLRLLDNRRSVGSAFKRWRRVSSFLLQIVLCEIHLLLLLPLLLHQAIVMVLVTHLSTAAMMLIITLCCIKAGLIHHLVKACGIKSLFTTSNNERCWGNLIALTSRIIQNLFYDLIELKWVIFRSVLNELFHLVFIRSLFLEKLRFIWSWLVHDFSRINLLNNHSIAWVSLLWHIFVCFRMLTNHRCIKCVKVWVIVRYVHCFQITTFLCAQNPY